MKHHKKGFTLMELLIVVLIIGVLAAIALPQYQKSVLKSRFSALMPIGKAMSDSNEAYYLEHGEYAHDADDLPVQGKMDYPDGTELAFGTTTDYAYVLVKNEDKVPNNYIVYQKHSGQFSGEAHCEALDGDTQAAEVCNSSGFTKNKGHILSDTHTTYTREGEGNGTAPGVRLLAALSDCNGVTKPGYTCTNEIDVANGTATRKVCNTTQNNGQTTDLVCFATKYNADGSYMQYGTQGVGGVNTNVALFDADGKKLAEWESSVTQAAQDNLDPKKPNGWLYEYDENGRLFGKAYCTQITTSGECTGSYSTNRVYVYDDNTGKLSRIAYCDSRDSNGRCTKISNSNWVSNITYDGQGRLSGYSQEGYNYSIGYDADNNPMYINNSRSSGKGGKYTIIQNEDGTGFYTRSCYYNVSADGSCSYYFDNGNDTFYFGSIIEYLSFI